MEQLHRSLKPGIPEGVEERVGRVTTPDRIGPARRERLSCEGESLWPIEPLVRAKAGPAGAVVHVEQDQVQASLACDNRADVVVDQAHASVVEHARGEVREIGPEQGDYGREL